MNISWDNIDKLEDYYITYLLYKESRTVSQISKIRNLSIAEINEQLIKAKLEIKSMLKEKVELSKDIMEDLHSLAESALEIGKSGIVKFEFIAHEEVESEDGI